MNERSERIAKALHHAEYGWARGRWAELANDVRWLVEEVRIRHLEDENRYLNRRVSELQPARLAVSTEAQEEGKG